MFPLLNERQSEGNVFSTEYQINNLQRADMTVKCVDAGLYFEEHIAVFPVSSISMT